MKPRKGRIKCLKPGCKTHKPAGSKAREKYPCDHCGGIVNVEWYDLGRRCEDRASCAKREKAKERVIVAAARWEKSLVAWQTTRKTPLKKLTSDMLTRAYIQHFKRDCPTLARAVAALRKLR